MAGRSISVGDEETKIPVIGYEETKIPVIGYGTAEFPLGAHPETMKESILHAIKVGYRHFDTAAIYLSEQQLGEAIGEAIRIGLIKSRDELFITSKLWCSDAHPHLVLPALKQSLQVLKVEYLDLYLIHWPVSLKEGTSVFPLKQDDLVAMDYHLVWEALEECKNLGLTKLIGVCNFSIKKLQIILSKAKIPPAVNQVEMNPIWQQKKLREFCEGKGIRIEAYSPLGGKGTPWGSNKVFENDVLQDIARAHGKSLPQICLRWLYEQGVIAVVKSFNKKRIEENVGIFGWELSPDESQRISQIPQERVCLGEVYLSENGPFKCLQDLCNNLCLAIKMTIDQKKKKKISGTTMFD